MVECINDSVIFSCSLLMKMLELRCYSIIASVYLWHAIERLGFKLKDATQDRVIPN